MEEVPEQAPELLKEVENPVWEMIDKNLIL